MKIGVVFPQTEIGQDPALIRDYAQAVESMGYTHMLANELESASRLRTIWRQPGSPATASPPRRCHRVCYRREFLPSPEL